MKIYLSVEANDLNESNKKIEKFEEVVMDIVKKEL